MSTILLNQLRTVFTPTAVTELAQVLGQHVTATQKAVDGLLPALTSGVINRATSEDGAHTLYRLLQSTPFTTDPTVNQLIDTDGHRQKAAESGNTLLTQLFNERAQRLTEATSQYSGLSSTAAQPLTGLVMSVLMGFLHEQITTRSLTQNQLVSLLGEDATSTREAIPGALALLLSGFIGTEVKRPVRAENVAPSQEEDRSAGLPAWLKWLLAALALLLLLFLLMRSCNRNEPATSTTTTDTSVSTATDTIASDLDGNELATEKAGPEVRVGVDLPGGRKLNLVENSFNYSLAHYLADKSRQTPKVFTFDNLTFETNSAQIIAKAQPHVDDLIQIMQAYPSLSIRIEGNTDSTGDNAINDPLSAERANAVKAALVKAGIQDSRITTRELGDTKPVASNQTQTGRQKNRRIDIVVTKV